MQESGPVIRSDGLRWGGHAIDAHSGLDLVKNCMEIKCESW